MVCDIDRDGGTGSRHAVSQPPTLAGCADFRLLCLTSAEQSEKHVISPSTNCSVRHALIITVQDQTPPALLALWDLQYLGVPVLVGTTAGLGPHVRMLPLQDSVKTRCMHDVCTHAHTHTVQYCSSQTAHSHVHVPLPPLYLAMSLILPVCLLPSLSCQVGAERYNLFKGCPEARTATIVLRGGSEQFIDEADRSLHDAIMIVRRALKHSQVVPGGGAIEMEVSRKRARVRVSG